MAVRESRPDPRRTTPIWESSQALTKKLSICPTRSQRYDQSVVMRLQNTMAVRDKYANRCDRSSGQIRMTKKDVTPTVEKFIFAPWSDCWWPRGVQQSSTAVACQELVALDHT